MTNQMLNAEKSSSIRHGEARANEALPEISTFADHALVQQRRSEGGGAPEVASGLVGAGLQLRRSDGGAASGLVGSGLQLRRSDGAAAVTSGLVGSGVQRRGDGGESSGLVGGVHAAAAHGVATSASSLPHLDAIQRSFGRHDVSAVQAHTGSEARASADAMGADAYATGNHVVFGRGSDLFTAAHEAAHVVQQRGGVQLKGGVGQAGDAYERHADDVAAMVVQGKSAESLLDSYAGGGGGGPSGVQRMEGQSSARTSSDYVSLRSLTPLSGHVESDGEETSTYTSLRSLTPGAGRVDSDSESEDEEFFDAVENLEPEAGWEADDERSSGSDHGSRRSSRHSRAASSEIQVVDEHARPGQSGRHSRAASSEIQVVDEHARPERSPGHSRQASWGSDGSFVDIPLRDEERAPAAAPVKAAKPPPAALAYAKTTANVLGALGTLVSALGWIVIRRYPLVQPIGQSLGAALKNGFNSIDDFYKGNYLKGTGQVLFSTGVGTGLGGTISTNKTGNASLFGIRSGGSWVTGTGMAMSGVHDAGWNDKEKKRKDYWRAGGNFLGAALNVMGTIGFAVEAAHSHMATFLAFEAATGYYNTAAPFGGTMQDREKSKDKRPFLQDPKVFGQAMIHVGFLANATALALNKIYLTKDKETGGHEAQQYLQLIQALGATGMFLSSAGHAVGAYAEYPAKKKPAPKSDIEMGTLAAPENVASTSAPGGEPPTV